MSAKSTGEAPGANRILLANRQRKVKVDAARLEEVAAFLLECLGQRDTEISIALLSDARIRQLNRSYLGRDRPTDVLSFSQVEGEGAALVPRCLGDVVIGAETAARQAEERGISLEEELDLLLAHGILHLLGYEHTRGRAEAATMERKQRQLLEKIRNRHG